MEESRNFNVIPCSQYLEPGTYFGADGGYVKLEEKYLVGTEMFISMDIRPRKTSGLLLSVYGKHHYLVLELVRGKLTFTMFNGKMPIITTFTPRTEFDLCDGKWHHIQGK